MRNTRWGVIISSHCDCTSNINTKQHAKQTRWWEREKKTKIIKSHFLITSAQADVAGQKFALATIKFHISNDTTYGENKWWQNSQFSKKWRIKRRKKIYHVISMSFSHSISKTVWIWHALRRRWRDRIESPYFCIFRSIPSWASTHKKKKRAH